MKTKGKTGLYFGSFNPVHNGHLAIASHIADHSDLEQIWFVISPHNPLKEKNSLLADHHRLAMLKAAIEDDSRFSVCDAELRLPQPSYTIHTLIWLEEKYPNRIFLPIVGSDNLESFKKWKNWELLLQRYNFLVYPRPGFNGGELANHPSFQWIDAPLMQISSSYIRKAIREKKDVRYLLPEKVYQYIREMHFYEK